MEIPRQKKTVRVAVTRPSVKKGAIVHRLRTVSRQRRFRFITYWVLVLLSGCFPAVQTRAVAVQARVFPLQLGVNELGVFYLFSFLPQRETVC